MVLDWKCALASNPVDIRLLLFGFDGACAKVGPHPGNRIGCIPATDRHQRSDCGSGTAMAADTEHEQAGAFALKMSDKLHPERRRKIHDAHVGPVEHDLGQ